MIKNIYLITAFSDTLKGGNLAGVVLDADNLSNQEKQRIAKEVGVSETAFVSQSKVADFKVQFFTPLEEVDLCGHATIATFKLLSDLGYIQDGIYRQETKAGILEVYTVNDKVMMQQTLPSFHGKVPFEEINKCFDNQLTSVALKNIFGEYIDLAPEIVSTGLKDIMLPIKDYQLLNDLRPNFYQIKQLSEKYDVIGIHAFSLEAKEHKYFATTRNFAPRVGIDEEAATGTSNGALTAFLNKLNILPDQKQIDITIQQGISIGRPSQISTSITLSKDKQITKILVGGKATIIKKDAINF